MNPYVKPVSPQSQYPSGLTLTQFIQTVLVGISGVPGDLCRPKWQTEPPKQPDIFVTWMGFAIEVAAPDANSYLGSMSGTQLGSQRHENLEVSVSVYGPNALEIYGVLRDGFQIPQNRIALFNANMGFTEISPARTIPDLVNQRWVGRVESSIFLRREIQRTYGVPTILSASGIIYVPDVTPDYQLPWEVQQ